MDDVGGVVGSLVHADGVCGASFFTIYLRSCEMMFEVFLCFVREAKYYKGGSNTHLPGFLLGDGMG